MKAISKSIEIYKTSLETVFFFSIFALLSAAFLPMLSGYVNVGSGFVRFSSVIMDLTLPEALLLTIVGLASLLLLSMFISSLVTMVKMKETLDEGRLSRVAREFRKYVLRVFLLLLVLSSASIALGVALEYYNIPREVTQLAIFGLLTLFTFAPQILVLEDLGIFKALLDSIRFVRNSPRSLAYYIAAGTLLVFGLVLLETGLGQFLVWEHKAVAILLSSVFVLPFLQILATELYLSRYPISTL